MRTSTPLFITLGVFTLFLAGCSNPQAEIQAALAGVCSGQGASQAAEYMGSDIHPIVLLAASGESHGWSNDLPAGWNPGSVEETQLVACVEAEEEAPIEVCQYDGPDITRYRYEAAVRVVEARTGAVVAATVLMGIEPRQCRSTEDYDLTRLAGDPVPFSAAADWLHRYAEGDAAPVVALAGPSDPGLFSRERPAGQSVWVYCGQVPGQSPVTVDAAQPVTFSWSWMAGSEENVYDYLGAASFDLHLDGESVELAEVVILNEECEWGFCPSWWLPPVTLERGSHILEMTVTLSRDVSTGLDFDENGMPEMDEAGVWVSEPCEGVAE